MTPTKQEEPKARNTSKALLALTAVFGLVMLALGKLETPANLAAFALIHIGAILNRLDSRRQGYKATISAGGATATVEKTGEAAEADDE